MKDKLFVFPFYPLQWLTDCSVLTLEEKGAYITLISTMYLQDDCSVYKRHIASILGVTEFKAKKIMQNIEPMLLDKGDKYSQKKVLEVKKQIEQRSEMARKKVQKRWNKSQTYKPKVYNKPKVIKQGPIPTLSAAQRARKMLNDGYE